MLFSIHTDDDIKLANGNSGYSYGYYKIIENFSKYKYKDQSLDVVENSPAASVQMFYMEPERYAIPSMRNMRGADFRKFHDHQYKIYGTHLEATKVWSHWLKAMDEVDEIWVGNYFAKDAVVNSGVKTPVFVFEHGIDEVWKPKKRGLNSKIRFLHVDSSSPRKRVDLVRKAFIELFSDNPNVELTLKYRSGEGSSKGYDVMDLFNKKDNIFEICENFSEEEMVKLYHDHDVLVYPSEGEGFGFIPLQALASGMPVITTSRWCSYEKFLGNNIIESTIGPTKSTAYFEGEVILPEYDSLIHLMKKVYENITSECNFYFNQAESVHKEYSWQNRCNLMLDSFINRVGVDIFDPHPDYIKMTPTRIKYTGNGSYSTASGVRFSRDNPVQYVPKYEYESLMFNENFQKAV